MTEQFDHMLLAIYVNHTRRAIRNGQAELACYEATEAAHQANLFMRTCPRNYWTWSKAGTLHEMLVERKAA